MIGLKLNAVCFYNPAAFDPGFEPVQRQMRRDASVKLGDSCGFARECRF